VGIRVRLAFLYIYSGSGTCLYSCPCVFRLTCTVLVDVVGDVVNPNFYYNIIYIYVLHIYISSWKMLSQQQVSRL
jgi:hypothetical protein